MKTRILFFTVALVISGFLINTPHPAHGDEAPPRITKNQLKGMLDKPGVVILDVRSGLSVRPGVLKIKGAVREDPAKVKDWAKRLDKNKAYVLYCS
jgi:rhodanese-related sulfurtransferase